MFNWNTMQDESHNTREVSEFKSYEERAMAYAEHYGIVEFKVKDNAMIYYTSWPMERTTYKVTVNLDIIHETREAMRRYYKPYKHIGDVQVNYMA